MIVEVRDFLPQVLRRLVLRNGGSFFSLLLGLPLLVLKELVPDQHVKHEDLVGTDLDSRI